MAKTLLRPGHEISKDGFVQQVQKHIFVQLYHVSLVHEEEKPKGHLSAFGILHWDRGMLANQTQNLLSFLC